MKRRLAAIANRLLRPIGAELTKYDFDWDHVFKAWVREATATGRDPNEVGDQDWADDPLRVSLDRFYLPYVSKDSVVFELGPGSGRLTRHVISRCAHMILADYSPFACKWLPKYLQGKGSAEVVRLSAPTLPGVDGESVDTVLANCAFDHICFEDMYTYFEEFHRILRPQGIASLNFVDFTCRAGLEHFKGQREPPGVPCAFKYYHPEVVVRMAEDVGFEVQRLETVQRYAYLVMEKRPSPAVPPEAGDAANA